MPSMGVMLREYLTALIGHAKKASWAAANGIEGAVIAGGIMIWRGLLPILSGTDSLSQATNWMASFLLYAIFAWGLLFIVRIVLIAPFQLWKADREARMKIEGKLKEALGAPLEIIFDNANPSNRYWSIEAPIDEGGNKKPGMFWEYTVEIKNNSSRTLRNVSVTIEHIGQNLPKRPIDTIFDKIRKTYCDLKPGCSELAPVIRWPIPKIQAGMLAGSFALEYGPIRVIASGDDVQPSTRTFKFDYQAEPMLFD
jgi:hypothetical protein